MSNPMPRDEDDGFEGFTVRLNRTADPLTPKRGARRVVDTGGKEEGLPFESATPASSDGYAVKLVDAHAAAAPRRVMRRATGLPSNVRDILAEQPVQRSETAPAEAFWTKCFIGLLSGSVLGLGIVWFLTSHNGKPAEATAVTQPVAVASAEAPAVPELPSSTQLADPPPALAIPPPAPAALQPVEHGLAQPAPPTAEEDRPVARIVAEARSPQDLVVAAGRKLDQGDPNAALQLLLEGDRANWGPASLDLGRLYDATLPHRFDVPAPNLGYAIERYVRARDRSPEGATADLARQRLDAVKAVLAERRDRDPDAAVLLDKYFH